MNEPIAIIGSGCRLAGGCDSPSTLWTLLQQPYDVSQDLPPNRIPPSRHNASPRGYFLSQDVANFDASFFNLNPLEAQAMDPQHRLLLETVYEALEEGGIPVEELRGSDTAVYTGVMFHDYLTLSSQDNESISTYHITGTAPNKASNRISHFFDWHGPSVTVDTACSSSLVALHQAVQQLRSGESRLAVAAGANLLLDSRPFIGFSNLGMLSPTGSCKMWDISADGYARGEGITAILLKPLSRALANGDNIQCVIRETGVNHDGRTSGITLPSAAAQVSLIQDVYRRAGLDPTQPCDRPQYIEAHGTGTQAGDPVEAEALATAFSLTSTPDHSEICPVWVGSIKTVVGHTEGAAGLAGVLKASLALQHGIIPPNLGFQQLNPKVAPYCTQLTVPIKAEPWSERSSSSATPRRASVNSFGFGGTNAHVILESLRLPDVPPSGISSQAPTSCSSSLLPYVFSAASERSLIGMLKRYKEYLQAHPSIDSAHLASTMAGQRSLLPVRISFPASSLEVLQERLATILAAESPSAGHRSSLRESRILGIFTGQGAQWSQMGAGLMAAYPPLASFLDSLDAALQSLPEEDRPSWSLREELQRPSENSRLEAPEICQPACTAVQLMLAHLLQAVGGVLFAAVVGHSSGEIAAAAVAGFLRPRDAIRIAFYRGLHVSRMLPALPKEGQMLAAGLSQAAAEELVNTVAFEGRLGVAAVNSSSSVTLSGDADAVAEMKAYLDSCKVFNRLLKVGTAYHSHHMRSCAAEYHASLARCQVEVLRPSGDNAPRWYSSVRSGQAMIYDSDHDSHNVERSIELAASYWVDNLVNPVLFHHAVSSAITNREMEVNFCLELGPHPALQGPAMQTIIETRGSALPYSGTLHRSKADKMAISECLGDLWVHLGSAGVPNLQAFGHTPHRPGLTDLPRYPWDHEHSFWVPGPSTRSTRRRVTQHTMCKTPVHSLLGSRDELVEAVDATNVYHWSNVLCADRLNWLRGHILQGQMIFPATGYLALAVEAALQVAAGRPVQAITLEEVNILKALRVDEKDGASTTVTAQVSRDNEQVVQARFRVDVDPTEETSRSTAAATMNITIHLGNPVEDLLPEATSSSSPAMMTDLDPGHVYSHLAGLGYEYTGPFQRITRLRRSLGKALAGVDWRKAAEDEPVLHPALLDNAVQVLFSAFTDHRDGSLWNLYMPVSIERVTVNLPLCSSGECDTQFTVESYVHQVDPHGICGDVSMFNAAGQGVVQMERINTMPASPATADNDLQLFSETRWGVAEPNGELALGSRRATPAMLAKTIDWERVALYYISQISGQFVDAETGLRTTAVDIEPHHGAFLDFSIWLQKTVRTGQHPYASPQWLKDTAEQIDQIRSQYSADDIDFKLIRMASEVLPAVIRHDTTMLQSFMADDTLSEWYQNSLVCAPAQGPLGAIIAQLAHRYRQLQVLEIGAGTGCATRSVLPALGDALARYTFTDVSAGFFDKAAQQFAPFADRMEFQTFDLDVDPMEQGFKEGSYDVVVAYAVLHVAASLKDALRRVRRLLKPGGFLILTEVLGDGPMALGLIFGGFTGWWAGREEGRRYSPTVSLETWQELLAATGFSGVDTHTPLKDPIAWPISVMVAQAVDEQVSLLPEPVLEELVIVAEPSFPQPEILQGVQTQLAAHTHNLTLFHSLEELNGASFPNKPTVLNLAHLDPESVRPSEEAWQGLQTLVDSARHMLWITDDYRAGNSSSALSVGLARSLAHELPHLRLQMIDISRETDPDTIVRVITKSLLRLVSTSDPDALPTFEPELALDSTGQLLVPRLHPLEPANNRLNSSRRKISAPIHVERQACSLEWHKDMFTLVDKSPFHSDEGIDSRVVRTTRSALTALPTRDGPVFLHQGVDSVTGETVVLASNEISSILTAPKLSSIVVSPEISRHSQYFGLLAAHLLIASVVKDIAPGTSVLLYAFDPPAAMYQAIWTFQLQAKKRQVHYFTGSKELAAMGPWVYCNPRAPRRVLNAAFPKDLHAIINLSGNNGAPTQTLDSLPGHFQRYSPPSGVAEASFLPALPPLTDLTELLSDAHTAAEEYIVLNVSAHQPEYELPDLLACQPGSLPGVSVVNWSCPTPLPVHYQLIDASTQILRPDRTYWLVGLTGDLGQSLCDWMVHHGARTIILTSRRPQMSPDWVESHHQIHGAKIISIAGDITSLPSLHAIYKTITTTYPTLDGIANGAMLMRENFFTQTTAAELHEVLQPKVQGLRYLDNLVGDQPLRFFIAFSSILATLGNLGQSAYTAANVASEALITQRRRRHLTGSVIQISRMTDVGYVKRQRAQYSAQEMARLEAYCLPMGEQHLHALFAEGIRAGRPSQASSASDVAQGSVITAGIPRVNMNDLEDSVRRGVTWATNVRFSHYWKQENCLRREYGGMRDGEEGKKAASTRERLAQSKSKEEAQMIILDGIVSKVRSILHLPADQPVLETTALVDLGVDSLIAVDIRAWIMGELGVDVPVLKLLVGITVEEIVREATAGLGDVTQAD
ncbi:polyketide synthase [Aspergillus eucalypticola CBS 122712]|uniref:Polyketide synthase n=1 Tax=Aspergillus eucalypticola (strain CBS 122712 / IBT 29274) TaxID=1448314 RepID=A0A317VWA6_ASPEC|nr:polyketide synthase [Aspergillus eucalypticola CBS 122712]PWY77879.1 polyketide synthase [Aspergillus eucalypticola CBS 122712]